MKLAATAVSLALVAGCAALPPPRGVLPGISSELAGAAERKPPARPEALDRALLPPVQMGMPSVAGVDLEPRFDLNVSNAPAAQVFMSIVSGTRYSILLHPDVSGLISVSLEDVTVEETRSARRELESGRVSTLQQADFWSDLRTALLAIVGTGEGRSVIVTPQSGVVVIRAFPQQLRAVEQYLRATRLSIERQVMLEAKIIEVTLSSEFQSGINWGIFNRNIALGQLSTNAANATQLAQSGTAIGTSASATGLIANTETRSIATATGAFAASNPAGAVFGLALQTPSFAALLTFLESQGNVQVLSSPRIATLNSQKAVLKVGTDEFFVTNVSTTTVATGSTSQTSPTVTVQPFFSGIVLDVTPQIDEGGNIILHIHPAVSEF